MSQFDHEDRREGSRPASRARVPARSAGADGKARVTRDSVSRAAVLDLQRAAGNARVVALLSSASEGAPVVVQRHSSFEHTLLGNTPPSQLSEAAVLPGSRQHLLTELARQTNFFRDDPMGDPRKAFPDVRWVQLRASQLWLSYGELTSMADYLPSNIDDLSRDIVEPVVQRMRRLTAAQHFKALGMYGEDEFAGEAEAGGWEFIEAVGIEKAMDKATSELGADRYFGMVQRNACHFAPESWHRWARFHEEAVDNALAYYRGKKERIPLASVDTSQDEHLRQAWLNNGYGDHFLQDSFAAGHLVNKTLVMQWFIDYVNGLSSKWWDLIQPSWGPLKTKPWYGMPSDAVMENMGTVQQPNMAGAGLYHAPTDAGTSSMDRELGDTPTDPQTARERESREGRLAGSGVVASAAQTRDQNYQTYLQFLNNSFLGMAAKETHDYFNERGLTVMNDRGDRMNVGGDGTLLEQSGALGASRAAEAEQMSKQAIDDLTKTGQTDKSIEKISQLWPTKVWVGGEDGHALPLQDWHEEVLHQLCVEQIFPGVVDSFSSKAARAGQPALIPGGIVDPAIPRPPMPDDMGDFTTPRGDPMG
jgi:hypothetical protein